MEKGRGRDQERKHAEGVLGELWCILCAHTIIRYNLAPHLCCAWSLCRLFCVTLHCQSVQDCNQKLRKPGNAARQLSGNKNVM